MKHLFCFGNQVLRHGLEKLPPRVLKRALIVQPHPHRTNEPQLDDQRRQVANEEMVKRLRHPVFGENDFKLCHQIWQNVVLVAANLSKNAGSDPKLWQKSGNVADLLELVFQLGPRR